MKVTRKYVSALIAGIMIFGVPASAAKSSSMDYIANKVSIDDIAPNASTVSNINNSEHKQIDAKNANSSGDDFKELDEMISRLESMNVSSQTDINTSVDNIKSDIIDNKVVETKDDNKIQPVKSTNDEKSNEEKSDVSDESVEVIDLSLQEAIDMAMQNNTILKQLEVDLEAAGLTVEETDFDKKHIKDGERDLEDASDKLGDLDNALSNIPDSMKDKPLNEIPGFDQIIASNPDLAGIAGMSKEQIETNVINPGRDAISEGDNKLDLGLTTANSVIAQKLNLSVDKVLGVNSTTELMSTMAELQNEVTKDGYQMAKKQVALLTRQKYYEVLKCKKIEMVKKSAYDRANNQYLMAKDAYEIGMKAKDDMLLAQSQANLMNVDYRNAKMNTENAMIDLKKTIGMDLNTNIKLEEDFSTEKIEVDLEKDIAQGLEKRIEIRKALSQYLVDKLNFELTAKKYPEMTFQYRDAKIKMDKSKVIYDSQAQEVEASIRKSYQAVLATEDMMDYIQGVVANAKESLEIAEYRYQEGYGFETSVIKGANLEDSAGTMTEVLAAQERLADIQEKAVEVVFNYNLARDKYLTDIGTY